VTRLLSWPPAPSPAAHRGRGLPIPGDYLGAAAAGRRRGPAPRGSHTWRKPATEEEPAMTLPITETAREPASGNAEGHSPGSASRS
jgi:hypothetical protein